MATILTGTQDKERWLRWEQGGADLLREESCLGVEKKGNQRIRFECIDFEESQGNVSEISRASGSEIHSKLKSITKID